MPDISDNLCYVQQQIISATNKVKRDFQAIKLVAVSKTISVETMNKAVQTGVKVFGENKVQELVDKIPQFPSDVEWHMIGHLQTNKVKYIIDKVHLIHSLDRISLAQEISKRSIETGRNIDVLVEVNIGGESTKHGLQAMETKDFIEEISGYSNIKIKGLMTVAPFVKDPEEVRPVFRQLRLLAQDIKNSNIQGVSMDILSMGMSNDFPVAIEEGATIIRVGSKIFGERVYKN